MICRVCGAEVRGDSCEPRPQMFAFCSTPHAYLLAFNCTCGATLAFTMWLSESEALQRHLEEKRYQDHRTALSALAEARKSGAAYAVIRRLEKQEEQLAYAE